MDANIRNYIIQNFKNNGSNDIKESIEESIKKGDEITLPGLGVFFEIIWQNSNDIEKEKILTTIQSKLA